MLTRNKRRIEDLFDDDSKESFLNYKHFEF